MMRANSRQVFLLTTNLHADNLRGPDIGGSESENEC